MTELRRTLNLPMMILYGVGTTVGAGIYALVGEIASIAGYHAPLAFLLASLFTAFTALSFAELSGRFPRAAGAALYVQNGFGSIAAARVVGLLVACAGVVSAAAMLNGVVGYVEHLIPLNRGAVIVAVAIGLGAVASWGIAESVTIAAIITVLEVAGLVVVIGSGGHNLAELPMRLPEMTPGLELAAWAPVLAGSLLAFYAFIGFEDMVDVAEEVKDVRRTLPIAILATLGITALLYVAIMTSAVLSMEPSELAKSGAPLAALFEHNTGKSAWLIGVIGIVAIVNGALIQIIMASRVLYGLASRGQLPRYLAKVNPVTQTPVVATIVVTALIAALALMGRLASLAAATSIIILIVFAAANLALWRIKREQPESPGITVPKWIPLTGFVVCAAIVSYSIVTTLVSKL